MESKGLSALAMIKEYHVLARGHRSATAQPVEVAQLVAWQILQVESVDCQQSVHHNCTLEKYMSLSADEFSIAINKLSSAWHKEREPSDWESVNVVVAYGLDYLHITRRLSAETSHPSQHDNALLEDTAVAEDDDEALPISRDTSRLDGQLVYDVVHSASYQVPILYLSFKNFVYGFRPTLDNVYDLLVPNSQQDELKSVGVMGAVSTTEHPMTGMPAYFVHPCRTQEAMIPMLQARDVDPVHYLLLWLGTIGGSVGLQVPVELAQRVVTNR